MSANCSESGQVTVQGARLRPNLGLGPIFLFTMHRSGGTLLQRLVNACPNTLIWGEHGGFINKLAEADLAFARYENLSSPVHQRRLELFTEDRRRSNFDPWTNPFDRQLYREHVRRLIQEGFSAGLSVGQRWGFKEIRYHSVVTASFLIELFPDARIVLLRRKLAAVVVSCITAPWSLNHLREIEPQDVAEVVDDVAYAIVALAEGDTEILKRFPNRCFPLSFEKLQEGLPAMYEFLDLPMPAGIESIIRTPLGKTDELASIARVGRSDLLKMAASAILAAEDKIRMGGIRKQDIIASRFGFLAGDHGFAGTGMSTLV